jgi:hypothetical protein
LRHFWRAEWWTHLLTWRVIRGGHAINTQWFGKGSPELLQRIGLIWRMA